MTMQINGRKHEKVMKKLQYIWDYYKLALALAAIAIYIVIYIIYRHLTVLPPCLYVGLINVSAGDTLLTELTDDFLNTNPAMPEGIRGNRTTVKPYTELLLSDNVTADEGSYVYASQMKILATIDGQLLDLVIMDKEAFDAFSQNGYLYNMEEFLDQLALLHPELSEEEMTELKNAMVVNMEILEDNLEDVRLDKTISYESVTTEYPMGLSLQGVSCIEDAGFPEELYLGIIKNSPRTETVSDYLLYLFE